MHTEIESKHTEHLVEKRISQQYSRSVGGAVSVGVCGWGGGFYNELSKSYGMQKDSY